MKKLTSSICSQRQLESPQFQDMCKRLNVSQWFDDFARQNGITIPKGILHRKSWEFAYIVLALQEHGMLKEGKRGLGFAVGTEPLPSYFASKGCRILATDLGQDEAGAWAKTGQNAGGSAEGLNVLGLCPDEVFRKNVRYRDVDMNAIPEDLKKERFDFCWSSCAIEHVGSLNKSKRFIMDMLGVLKPGGIAVHTTEFNLSSQDETILFGENVLWRKKDIEQLQQISAAGGGKLYTVDYSLGDEEGDRFVDEPPYYRDPRYHLRLMIGPYISTSIGLIIQKRRSIWPGRDVKKALPPALEEYLASDEYLPQMVPFPGAERRGDRFVVHPEGILAGPYISLNAGTYRWRIALSGEGGDGGTVLCRVTADSGKRLLKEMELPLGEATVDVSLDDPAKEFEIVFYNRTAHDISVQRIDMARQEA